jgi:hypothetical protein
VCCLLQVAWIVHVCSRKRTHTRTEACNIHLSFHFSSDVLSVTFSDQMQISYKNNDVSWT